MSRHRTARGPFLLTETEKRALAFLRLGHSYREIAVLMGWKSHNCGYLIGQAVMKERSIALDDRGSEGHSTLGVARGRIRMEGTK